MIVDCKKIATFVIDFAAMISLALFDVYDEKKDCLIGYQKEENKRLQ